jgi:hypothetical protein
MFLAFDQRRRRNNATLAPARNAVALMCACVSATASASAASGCSMVSAS